jgi:hypothetical protein
LNSEKTAELTTNIAKVTSFCEKIDADLEKVPESPLTAIMRDMSAAIKLINSNHSDIVSGSGQASKPETGMISLGTIPKKNRVLSQAAVFEAAGSMRSGKKYPSAGGSG